MNENEVKTKPAEVKTLNTNTPVDVVSVCATELEAVLKKHNCSLDVQMIIGAGQVRPIVNVRKIEQGKGDG